MFIGMKKWVTLLIVFSLVGLLPVSLDLADSLFSRPFDARGPIPILLIFPERVEIRFVRELSEVSHRERIDLEANRDGFAGLIYDAGPDEIVPIASRIAGPGASFVFAIIDVVLCTALCFSFGWSGDSSRGDTLRKNHRYNPPR